MAGFYGILLIIALVGVSGLIAYVGDILGRRMGRKRLSLFGLRPRHTAITISVIAGMLITLFTLAVAMTVSRDVKDGFLRVEAMRRQQAQLQRQVEGLRRQGADLGKALKMAEGQLATRKSELASAKTQLEATRRALAATTTDLSNRKQELRKRNAELAALTKTSRRMQRVLTSTSLQLIELQRRVDAARATARQAAEEYALGRAFPILFGARQPLDVELFEGRQPVASAHRQLEAFVARITAKVTAGGARPLAGEKQAVIVTSSRLVRDPQTGQFAVAKPHQVLNAVAERVHESPGGVIVRAISLFNTHPGQPVYVDFELFANEHVFDSGAVLAQAVIDGRNSEPALMGALVNLLRDEVGAQARAKGVMPRITTPGGPSLFGSSSGAVGEMSYEELFQVIEQLRQINRPARVTAVAAQDTWTIGPLKVGLRVEPITVARSTDAPPR